MKLSAAAIVFATLGYVSAAAVSVRDEKIDLQRDYDKETQDLKNRGLCRKYEGRDEPSYSKFTDLCEPKCGDAKKIVDETHKTYSVTCAVTGTTTQPTFPDPEGKRYKLGQCFCNLPIVNWVGENFVASLPAIGQVTCAVWKEAAKDAASLLTGVGGVGAAKTGIQALIKVAKMLASQGKSASNFEEYVKKHVAAGDACSFDFKKMFEDAKKVSDEALANVGGA
ncbi:uncharacterized protein JN550_000549 [Neoarthrinium moseri]|uniref:uncharacterized protein n=1 Tax=Neoarthrinium moseri TaxID=1658444 RepID=UPI001FDDA94F|nr:uncharacterized protein JN550_000549 [Neoarthrinium moseri]KAI1878367.1 hypothetical protein JN550_000549 [Neoarthrinium moseri]